MKRLYQHAFVILLLIVLFNQLAIHSGKIYKDGASIVCEQKRLAVRNDQWQIPNEKATVLYFGASGILSALIPEVFDSMMEHRTYSLNLALPALPIGPYYHCLLDYMENNPPPEYIIMAYHVDTEPILLFDTYANQGIDFPGEVISYFFNRGDKNQTLNYLLPFHVYKDPIFKYLYNSAFNPSDIQETRSENNQIVSKMLGDRGYYFIMEQSKFPDGRLPDDYSEESDCSDCEMKMYDPESDVYVDKFFSLTREYDIQVLLVSHPVREGKYGQFEETPEPIRKLQNMYNNVSIPSEGWKIPFFENKYFSDPHHLNKSGAEKFSREIADLFREVYGEDSLLLTDVTEVR